jgi:hypothetical protein
MATRSRNTRTISFPNKREVSLAHASGWCADRPRTPTRSVSEASHSTPTRSVSEGPATQIDWRIVGLAGVMAGLFVVGSVLAVWAVGRPIGSTKETKASASSSPEAAGLAAVAKATNDKDHLTNSTATPAHGRLDPEAAVCPSPA